MKIKINNRNFPKKWNISTNNSNLRKAIYKAFDGKCFYTQRKVPFKKMQIDHVIPKNGKNLKGPDNIYNYVLSSPYINAKKYNKYDPVAVIPMLGIVRTHYAPKVQQEYLKLTNSLPKNKHWKIKFWILILLIFGFIYFFLDFQNILEYYPLNINFNAEL